MMGGGQGGNWRGGEGRQGTDRQQQASWTRGAAAADQRTVRKCTGRGPASTSCLPRWHVPLANVCSAAAQVLSVASKTALDRACRPTHHPPHVRQHVKGRLAALPRWPVPCAVVLVPELAVPSPSRPLALGPLALVLKRRAGAHICCTTAAASCFAFVAPSPRQQCSIKFSREPDVVAAGVVMVHSGWTRAQQWAMPPAQCAQAVQHRCPGLRAMPHACMLLF